MKLDELDESQGLTADMVREWLSAQNRSQLIGDVWTWRDGQLRDANLHHSLSFSLAALCAIGNKRPQQLLREINPRWRKGFPSNAALAEHDLWLIRAPWGAEFVAHISYGGSDDGYMIMIPPDSESGDCGWIEESVWGDCFYWPCDGNANRVRWPVDAEGKML